MGADSRGRLHAFPLTGASTVYRLNPELFLTEMPGHAPTRRLAEHIAELRHSSGAAPGSGDVD